MNENKFDGNIFINKVNEVFKQFDISNEIVKCDTFNKQLSNHILVINIEDDDMPKYKLACSFIDEGYLNIYASLNHKLSSMNELESLYDLVMKFNKESFLKFIIDENKILIRYSMIELSNDDVVKVVRVLSVIPSIVYEFYIELIKI